MQMSSGRASPDASSCSMSRAAACASARSVAERQKRTVPASPSLAGESRPVTAAAERADRLELVAGHDEVAVLGGERLEEALLGRAGVLELVGDHLGEALGEATAHVGT